MNRKVLVHLIGTRVTANDSARRNEGKPKFKYLLPLDDEIADSIKSLSKPYPNAPQAKKALRLESIQERAV
jgi:hypothetical protein